MGINIVNTGNKKKLLKVTGIVKNLENNAVYKHEFPSNVGPFYIVEGRNLITLRLKDDSQFNINYLGKIEEDIIGEKIQYVQFDIPMICGNTYTRQQIRFPDSKHSLIGGVSGYHGDKPFFASEETYKKIIKNDLNFGIDEFLRKLVENNLEGVLGQEYYKQNPNPAIAFLYE